MQRSAIAGCGFLLVLTGLFLWLLVGTATAPESLAVVGEGGWASVGIWLFVALNVLAVVFAMAYLWLRGGDQ